MFLVGARQTRIEFDSPSPKFTRIIWTEYNARYTCLMQARTNGNIALDGSCNGESIYKDQESAVRVIKIPRAAPKIEEYGFRLTRSKWDPYPWVCEVATGTPASLCGLKAGDCILKVNDVDILGMRILEIAEIVKSQRDHVTFLCWNSNCKFDCDEQSISCVPMPISLNRLVVIVDSILRVIECPVCHVTISPPVMQCQNGHLLCLECRIRTVKCPICRGFFTPIRSSVAEEIYSIIASAFKTCHSDGNLRQRVFGDVTFVKAKTCDHYLTASSTITLPETLKHRFDSPINNLFSKLLRTRAGLPENIVETSKGSSA